MEMTQIFREKIQIASKEIPYSSVNAYATLDGGKPKYFLNALLNEWISEKPFSSAASPTEIPGDDN